MSILLRDPSADVIVIDPEREYTKIARTFDGTLVHMSSTSDIHINALDINKDYSESADPVIEKSEFVMSLCEQIVGEGRLGPKAHSIIDRCTKKVSSEYQKNGYVGEPPTLVDLRNELELQPEKEAEDLSTALELFATGSLNTFAKKTNVDIDNRLIVYDIRDLGEQLMSIGMLVILDGANGRISSSMRSICSSSMSTVQISSTVSGNGSASTTPCVPASRRTSPTSCRMSLLSPC